MKKKVIISACLLGHFCRYDGKIKEFSEIHERFSEYEIIPFCPEDPLFGTPRERISVLKIAQENRILTDNTNKDVTQLLEEQIRSFIKQHPQADAIVLKSKSPSCGIGTTPILNQEKEFLHYGNGIAAELFLEYYKDLVIQDENTL